MAEHDAMTSPERVTETEAFTRIAREVLYDGHLTFAVERYRYPDGHEAIRDVLEGKEVVVVLAYDEDGVWMVHQAREAAGEADILELPAGGVDPDDGRDLLSAAQRELAEEVGKGARQWEHVTSFWSSPGGFWERMHLFFAMDLYDHSLPQDEHENVRAEQFSFGQLQNLIDSCRDAKSLVGLLEMRHRLEREIERLSPLSIAQQEQVVAFARAALAKVIARDMPTLDVDARLSAARFAGMVCGQLQAELAGPWPNEGEADAPPPIERSLLADIGAVIENFAKVTAPEGELRAMFIDQQGLVGMMREWGATDTDLRDKVLDVAWAHVMGTGEFPDERADDYKSQLFEFQSAALGRGWSAYERPRYERPAEPEQS